MADFALVYQYGQNKSLIQSLINQYYKNVYFILLDDKDNEQLNDISSTLIKFKFFSFKLEFTFRISYIERIILLINII
jgi:hypothetical protein